MNLYIFFKKNWLITLIFLSGLFLRVYMLSEFPVGVHGDEASIGYNAYSLLKTAKDQDGNFLPLAFDQFGNFRSAGYHYIVIPFIALFGLDAFSVRLPAALFGSFSVLVLYLFLLELFEKKFVANLGAFLLAILPWHINISRASSESIPASFLVILGSFFLLRALKKTNISFGLFIASFLSLFISIFFYHAAAFFVPVFIPFLLVLACYSYKPIKEIKASALVIFIALCIGLFLFLSLGKGGGRVSQVSLLSIPDGIGQLKQAINEEGTTNPIISRFYNNKLLFYGRLFVTFYSEHLSLDYLFINNGFPNRYKMPYTGNLYIIELPFLVLGFVVLLYEGLFKRKHLFLIPVVWLFIGPIPAGLTWEDLPNVIRSASMIPALVMIIAVGFYKSLDLFNSTYKKIFIGICSLALFIGFLYFYHNYYWRSKIHEPWNRSAAESDLLFTILDLQKQNKKIVMTTQNNNNFIFYLFYTKFDPKTFQNMGSPKEKNGLVFKNITYTYSDCPITGDPEKNAVGNKDVIFVNKPECKLPKNASVLSVIRTPDGSPAFYIIKLT